MKMKEKSEKTSGTNGLPGAWFTSFTMPAMKLYQISASDCRRLGTVVVFDVAMASRPMTSSTPITIHSAEVVKEMSRPPIFRSNSLPILNWCIGSVETIMPCHLYPWRLRPS